MIRTPLLSRESRSPATFWLLLFISTAVILAFGMLGEAFAQALPATVPAPVGTVVAGADAGLEIWTKDGPLWAAIVVAYVLLRSFLSHQHWLKQGRVLAGLTGLAGVAVAALNWHFGGAPVTGIFTAVFAAVALFHVPSSNKQPEILTGAGTGMVVAVLLFTGAAAVASQTSCAAARQHTAAGVVAALDCEAAHLDAADLADAVHLAEAGLQRAITGVSPGDMPALKAALAADLAPIKSDLGRCGVAGALAAIAGAVPARAGVATSALTAPGPDPEQVRLAAQAAARELGWPVVATKAGAL